MSPDGVASFFLLVNLCALGGSASLLLRNKSDAAVPGMPNTVKLLQRRFLIIYAIVFSADFVQSRYLFKLYSYYGLGKGEIGLLFVLGPVASAMLGTPVAGLADRIGRKKACMLFCLLFAGSAGSKHLASYKLMLSARVVEAIARSIFVTCFEGWVVFELEQNTGNGTRARAIVETLCFMSACANMTAIFWTFATPQIIQVWTYLAPFNVATGLCVVAIVGIYFAFAENHGRSLAGKDVASGAGTNRVEKPSVVDRLIAVFSHVAVGWMVLTSSSKIYLVGIVQTCMDTMLYILLLSWLPQVEAAAGESIIHEKLVVTTLMLSQTLGTALFLLLQQNTSIPGTKIKIKPIPAHLLFSGALLLALASSCLLALAPHSPLIVVFAFAMIHIAAGVSSPALAYLRALHVPNEVRVIVMNFLRIPFLCIQVLVLLNVGHLEFGSIAVSYIGLTTVAAIAQYMLHEKPQVATDVAEA